MMHLLKKWPLIRQILRRSDGTGVEAMSEQTRNLKARIHGTEVARSICPYCAVGCGQLIHHKDGKLVSIEGDPASPDFEGTPVPERLGEFRAPDAFESLDAGQVSQAAFERVGDPRS